MAAVQPAGESASSSKSLTLSQSLTSYQALYETLDFPSNPSSLSPESLHTILGSRVAQLRSCGRLGKPAPKNPEPVNKVVALNGEEINLSQEEKDLVLKISPRYDLDTTTAALLLRTLLRSEPSLPLPANSSSKEPGIGLQSELLRHFQAFLFRERLALILLVSSLFRASADEGDDYHEVASAIVADLLATPEGQPSFAETLFRQFIGLAQDEVPREILKTGSDDEAVLWAKQSLREQLALLEIVFLVLYSSPADADIAEGILLASHASGYGAAQGNRRLVQDDESALLLANIRNLLILISVEILDLETALSASFPASLLLGPQGSLRASPTTLLSLHSFFASSRDVPPTVLLAWSFLLSRLTDAVAAQTPEPFIPFAQTVLPGVKGSPAYESSVSRALQEGLFAELSTMMRSSLFVDLDTRLGGVAADQNSLGYRSVLKGLLSGLLEIVRAEFLPFDAVIEVWTLLYGSGSGTSSLCLQFWQEDFPHHPLRRSLLALAQSRFPVHLRPLFKLSRSLCGDEHASREILDDATTSFIPEAADCASIVFQFVAQLSSLAMVIPSTGPASARGIFIVEPGAEPGEVQYRTSRALDLPGGARILKGSVASVLSPPRATPIVLLWKVQTSGWRLVLEILRSFVGIRPPKAVAVAAFRDEDVFAAVGAAQEPGLRIALEDLGIEDCTGEDAILDILETLRSVLAAGPGLAADLVEHISPTVGQGGASTDIVQVLFAILERYLSIARSLSPITSKLVSTTLDILTSLLPAFPGRVWTYLRSSSLLFPNSRSAASMTSAIAAERAAGSYPTTLALVDLVSALFIEAQRTHFAAEPEFTKVKADVLLRALSLVHAEVWTGHTSWRYTSLRERFDLGRKVSVLYMEILRDPTLASASSATAKKSPLVAVQTFVIDAFLLNSTSLTLSPLLSTLVSGRALFAGLSASGRVFEAPKAERLIEVTLKLVRHLLTVKRRLGIARVVPLEQLFFEQAAPSRSATFGKHTKSQVVDVITCFATAPTSSHETAMEAVALLSALSSSLFGIDSTPPSIIGHLDDARETTRAFLKVLADPYQDRELRRAIWNMLSVLVSAQLGWATLFIDLHETGLPPAREGSSESKKDRASDADESDEHEEGSALTLARQALAMWQEFWESDPALLASILRFIDTAWQFFPDHSLIASLRADPKLWEALHDLAFCSRFKPKPVTSGSGDEVFSSSATEDTLVDEEAGLGYKDVPLISHRNLARAHAIHIYALDLESTGRRGVSRDRSPKSKSFELVKDMFSSPSASSSLGSKRPVGAATLRYLRSACNPDLHETVHNFIRQTYPGLNAEILRSRDAPEDREFGESYLYPIEILRQKLEGYRSDDIDDGVLQRTVAEVQSVNLEWSLMDSQIACTKAWRQFLGSAIALLLDSPPSSPSTAASERTSRAEILMSDIRTIITEIADEHRAGDIMLAVQVERMEILRCLVEGTLGISIMEGSDKPSLSRTTDVPASSSELDNATQLESLVALLPHLRRIVLSETFPPLESLRGSLSIAFHQPLLQTLFLFIRKAVDVPGPSVTSVVTAQQRDVLRAFLQTCLNFLVHALASTFERILATGDPALEDELALLVAVFEQAIRPEHHLHPREWLALADEIGLFRLSLDALASSPWLSNIALGADGAGGLENGDETEMASAVSLSTSRRPLFLASILDFHLAVSTIERGAERLVVCGVMASYSNNVLASVAEQGQIPSVVRQPMGLGGQDALHSIWLVLLGIIGNLIGSIGSNAQFVEAEIVPFVQLCGAQLTRCLDWRTGDPITSVHLQELEATATLFLGIATALESFSRPLRSVSVLRAFSDKALSLLQHINDLLSHPNHLFALIEPVTDAERVVLHKENNAIAAGETKIGSSNLSIATSAEPDGLPDAQKRPLLAAIMQKLLLLARTITFTLTLTTSSSKILSSEPETWAAEDALVLADPKVSPDEPATIGTLIELGTLAVDYHRQMASTIVPPTSSSHNKGKGKASGSAAPSVDDPYEDSTMIYLPEFSHEQCLEATRHTLEAISLLATTQLALAIRLRVSNGAGHDYGGGGAAGGGGGGGEGGSGGGGGKSSGDKLNSSGSGGEMERFRELGLDLEGMLVLAEGKMYTSRPEDARFLGLMRGFLEREMTV